jgi:hypothetical protein
VDLTRGGRVGRHANGRGDDKRHGGGNQDGSTSEASETHVRNSLGSFFWERQANRRFAKVEMEATTSF